MLLGQPNKLTRSEEWSFAILMVLFAKKYFLIISFVKKYSLWTKQYRMLIIRVVHSQSNTEQATMPVCVHTTKTFQFYHIPT